MLGMYKRGWHYRCSREKCKARRTLPRRIEEYTIAPRCRACGGTALRWDRDRALVHMQRKPCQCDGYAFLHRKGSKFCVHSPVELTADDIASRFGTARDPTEYLHAAPF
jgi:hypothetical protein